MSYTSAKKWNGDMLDMIYPEYERVSRMPTSVTEVPGFWELMSKYQDKDEAAKQRDKFEDAWLASEVGKLYKALTMETGEVSLITNPRTWGLKRQASGADCMVRDKPKKLGHILDLIKGDAMFGSSGKDY